MGQVKKFAMWIEECAFQKDMNDAQIISAANSHWSINDPATKDWLLDQIEVVRCNPHIYASHTSPVNTTNITDSKKEA